jgi:hypothetical protein
MEHLEQMARKVFKVQRVLMVQLACKEFKEYTVTQELLVQQVQPV